MLRLFFALQPTAERAATVLRQAAPLLENLGAPPVPVENFHATLCFVGAVAPERLDDLRAAAATVRAAPVTLRFDAFEYWDRPRVLCATASDDPGNAARELSAALTAASVAAGFAPDVKPFHAHLTLARKVSAAAATRLEWPRPLLPPAIVRCDSFVLMQSTRGEHGSLYSVIDSWPLDAKGPQKSAANIQ